MNIAITGCAGYIGSKLTKSLLDAGHAVYGFDNLMFGIHGILPLLDFPNFHFTNHDVSKGIPQSILNNVNVVIPLAALVGAPLCDKNEVGAWNINYNQIIKIVEGCKNEQRIIYPNTNSGYGSIGKLCTEEDPLEPISIYGKSKCAAEEAVLKYNNSAVLRLATVFGVSPRMRFDLLVNSFVYEISRKLRISIFDPQFKRNYVHVDDVVRAFNWMLDSKYQGVYNVGLPDANLTKMELAEKIADKFRYPDLESPYPMIEIGNGKDPDQRDYFVSSEKLLKTGFRFSKSLDYGIDELIKLSMICGEKFYKESRNV